MAEFLAHPGKHAAGRFAGALLVVIVLSSMVLARRLPTTNFHSDESGWISAGFHYADLLRRGDFAWEQWECQACGEWGGLHPHVGKLLLGVPLALYADQMLDGARYDGYFDISRSFAENAQAGRVPPPDILLPARTISLVFGVLVCVLVLMVGYLSTSSLTAGLLAAGLLLTNRSFVASATSAMTDIYLIFFLLCSLLAALWLVNRPQAFRQSAIVSGIGAGLAYSVKISGIAVGGLVFLLILVYVLLIHALRIRQGLQALILFSVSAVAVVYLVNPFFWPSVAGALSGNPLDEFRQFAAERGRIGTLLAGLPQERYPHLAQLARPLGFPLSFPRYSLVHDRQALLFPASSVSGVLEKSHVVLVVLSQAPFLWIMLIAGLGISSRRLWLSYQQSKASSIVGPLAFFLANYLIVLLFMQVSWPRYYLPTSVGAILLVGIGISVILDRIVLWSKRRWT